MHSELTLISEEGLGDGVLDVEDDEEDGVDADEVTSCAKVENHVMLSELEQNLIKEGEEVVSGTSSGCYVGDSVNSTVSEASVLKSKANRRRKGPLGRLLGRKSRKSSPAIPEAVIEENSV